MEADKLLTLLLAAHTLMLNHRRNGVAWNEYRQKVEHYREELLKLTNTVPSQVDEIPVLLGAPGEKIKYLREEKKLTQVQLAKRAHTTQANISSIESGSRVLGKDLAEKLGVALDVDYRILLPFGK
jgi:DNA-binding XRE family transcriptional regulator